MKGTINLNLRVGILWEITVNWATVVHSTKKCANNIVSLTVVVHCFVNEAILGVCTYYKVLLSLCTQQIHCIDDASSTSNYYCNLQKNY